MELLHRAGGERVAFFDLEAPSGWPIYVHSKVCVIDDVWMIVGSDNLNIRSWTNDSELSCAVIDQHEDRREPADPAGRGDGARVIARETRLRLWREHLGRNEGDDADNFGIRLPYLLLNQVVPDQVADRFRTVLIALTADASIESVQQILLERDPKSG
jgi:phosphatidylserine/phosphatidylglycerophosphate/cardiolipin synthase-like enzyme